MPSVGKLADTNQNVNFLLVLDRCWDESNLQATTCVSLPETPVHNTPLGLFQRRKS